MPPFERVYNVECVDRPALDLDDDGGTDNEDEHEDEGLNAAAADPRTKMKHTAAATAAVVRR